MERPADQYPWTQAELKEARERPEHKRTTLPVLGELVLFRREEWGPEVEAIIIAVQPLDRPTDTNGGDEEPDPHVWRVPDALWLPRKGERVELRPDPWPRVRVEAVDGSFVAVARESRVRGGPGWLRASEGKWMHEGDRH